MAASWWREPWFKEEGWRRADKPVPYFEAALLFMTVVYVFETYLDFRQHQKLKETEFPPALAEAIRGLGDYTGKTKKTEDDEKKEKTEEKEEEETEEATPPTKPVSLLDATLTKFDKSREYGLDKSTFGLMVGAFKQGETTILLLFGYLPFLWMLSGRCLARMGVDPNHEIYRSLLLFLFTSLHDTIVDLPFSLYSTFVVEERHGFNKQTLRLFFTDKLKSLLIENVIGFLITAVLIFVVRWGGDLFYLYVWAFLCVFSLIMITLYPVLIMPLFNKFDPLPEGELRTRIENLAASLHFPLTKLFVCDGSKRSNHSNAFFFGLFHNKRIVLYDTLLEQQTNDEIVAVLGHELGHWKRWHLPESFLIQQVYMLVLFYVFGLCMYDTALFASFGFATDMKPVMIGFLLFSSTVWAPVGQILTFLLTLNTRRNEFQADAFAVELGFAHPLQSGLTKLAIENLSNMNPDHLYSAYHYSHPPLLERLQAIAEGDKKRA